MARKPRPSEIAAKAKKSGTKAPKKPRAAKHGGTVVPKADMAAAEAKGNVPSTIKLPPKGAIKTLVGQLATMQAEAASYTGDIGKTIATAKEAKHVDTVALSIVRRLDKMTRNKKTKNAMQKFQTTFYHLKEYMIELGFQEIADKQGQLSLQQAEAAADDEGGEPETEATDEALPGTDGTRSPGLKLVDAPKSTADAMGEAIEQDRKTA